MKILGVDIDSRKFGATILEGRKMYFYYFFESEYKDSQERIFDLYLAFDKYIIQPHKPDAVFIEESMYAQNFKTSKLIAESVGNCKTICRLNLIPVRTIPNKSWKKSVIGNGNASKEDIKAFIIKKYKILKDAEQDVLDSCGVALAGQKLMKEKNESVFKIV